MLYRKESEQQHIDDDGDPNPVGRAAVDGLDSRNALDKTDRIKERYEEEQVDDRPI
jgi:hypothetical protein